MGLRLYGGRYDHTFEIPARLLPRLSLDISRASEKRSLGSVFFDSRKSLTYAGLLLLGLSWLATEHFAPWLSFHSEVLSFAAVFFLVSAQLVGPDKKTVLPTISIALLLVALIPPVQWIAGISFFAGDAVMCSLYLTGLAMALAVGYSWSVRMDLRGSKVQGLMLVLSAGAILSAGVGWVQWFSVEQIGGTLVVPSSTGRAIGNLAQPNQLATLLLMGMAAYTYLYKQRVVAGATFVVGVIFMSVALAMTQSRTAWLSALFMVMFWGWKSRHMAMRLSAYVGVLWLGLTFLLARLLPDISNALLITSKALPRSVDSSGSRWGIWQQVTHAIGQSPWVGYGWNQTFTAQTAGASAYASDQNYTYAHNVVLDLLAWSGVPIGATIVLGLGWWICTRMARTTSTEGVVAMLALLPFTVHSLLEFPFAYAYFLFTAGLLMGIVEASSAVNAYLRLAKPLAAAVLGGWILVSAWVVMEYIAIEEDYRVVRFENLRIGATPTSYAVPDIRLLSQMRAMLIAARIEVQPGMSREQIDMLRKAAMRFPYGLLAYKYALALALNGDAPAASRQMRLIRDIFGARYYADSKASLKKLTKDKYPELDAVVAP